MSPVLASALGSLDRRTLLLLSLVVFALGNAIVASSELYSVLVIGRMVAAIGASMFTPAALTITGGLVEPARRGRSIALVTSGLTVATVAGVPLGIGLAITVSSGSSLDSPLPSSSRLPSGSRRLPRRLPSL